MDKERRELVTRYLIDLIDLALAADEDGWCPDLAERAASMISPPPDPGASAAGP